MNFKKRRQDRQKRNVLVFVYEKLNGAIEFVETIGFIWYLNTCLAEGLDIVLYTAFATDANVRIYIAPRKT